MNKEPFLLLSDQNEVKQNPKKKNKKNKKKNQVPTKEDSEALERIHQQSKKLVKELIEKDGFSFDKKKLNQVLGSLNKREIKILFSYFPYNSILSLQNEKGYQPFLTGDVVNSSLLRSMLKLRREYLLRDLNEKDEKDEKDEKEKLQYEPSMLIPVFDKNGRAGSQFKTRVLDSEEAAHPHIVIPQTSRTATFSHQKNVNLVQTTPNPATVSNLRDFLINLEVFSNGVLKGIDFSNIVLGGSAVLCCLLPYPEYIQKLYDEYRTYEETCYSLPLPFELCQLIDSFSGVVRSAKKRFTRALTNLYEQEYFHSDLDLYLIVPNQQVVLSIYLFLFIFI